MTKRNRISDKEFDISWNEQTRRIDWERKIGDEITKRLFDLRTNYLLRYGSDPFTMFKLYVDITRGIKI